jgi:hypothetical protein
MPQRAIAAELLLVRENTHQSVVQRVLAKGSQKYPTFGSRDASNAVRLGPMVPVAGKLVPKLLKEKMMNR